MVPQLLVWWKCSGEKVERVVERAFFGRVVAVVMVNETQSSQIRTHLLLYFIFVFVHFPWEYPASEG